MKGAKLLAKTRKAHNLTLKELASKAGLSENHVWKMEKGKASINQNSAEKLASALDIQPSDLINVKSPRLNKKPTRTAEKPNNKLEGTDQNDLLKVFKSLTKKEQEVITTCIHALAKK